MRIKPYFIGLIVTLISVFSLVSADAYWQSRQQVSIVAAGGGCTESANFLARTSGLDATHTTAYQDLICGLVTDNVWSSLDALYIFKTADTTTALLSLVSATYNATAVNSPTFTTDSGYTGGGTSYIDSNFNPSTATSPKFVQNSASLFAWSNTSAATTGQIMGQPGLGCYIYPNQSGTAYAAINEAATFNFNFAVADGLGLYHANRSGASAEQFYKSGSSLGSATNASQAVENNNIRFLSAAAMWAGEIRAGGFGQSLDATKAAALSTRLTTFMAAF